MEKTRIEDEIFEKIVRGKKFNHSELELLYRLAGYLKKSQKKYLLLENQAIFNACSKKLQEERRITASLLASVRLKLGFKAKDPERIPHSSADLEEDMSVLIVQKGKRQKAGRIFKIEPHSLIITLENGILSPSSGSPLIIYFQKRSGLYALTTSVQKLERGMIRVAHSENIKRIQRRKFYRKKILLPVSVKKAGSEGQPFRTILIDLGGGGASLRNPGGRLEAGDEVELSFFTSGRESINLAAFVIRVSGREKIAHVTFGSITDEIRDRIIRYIFRRAT